MSIIGTSEKCSWALPLQSCWVTPAFAINHHIPRSLTVPRQLSTHPSFPFRSSFTFPSFSTKSPPDLPPPPTKEKLNYFPWTCVSLAAGTDDLTFKKRREERRKDVIIAAQVCWAQAASPDPLESVWCTVEAHGEHTHTHTQTCFQRIDIFSSDNTWKFNYLWLLSKKT